MRLNYLAKAIGLTMMYIGLVILTPIIAALYYHDFNSITPFATAALILADTTSAGTFSNDCISFPSVFFCHFVYFCHFISALLSDICHFAKTPGIIITQPILWNNRLFSY